MAPVGAIFKLGMHKNALVAGALLRTYCGSLQHSPDHTTRLMEGSKG